MDCYELKTRVLEFQHLDLSRLPVTSVVKHLKCLEQKIISLLPFVKHGLCYSLLCLGCQNHIPILSMP